MGITNKVQFRWKDEDGNKEHIIGEWNCDWKFQLGEDIRFWIGTSRVIKVELSLKQVTRIDPAGLCLDVCQLVWVCPLDWDPLVLEWDKKPTVG